MYFFDEKSSQIYLEDSSNQLVKAGNPNYFLTICRHEVGVNTFLYIVTPKKVIEVNCVEKTQSELMVNSKDNFFKAFKGMTSIVFQDRLCLIGGFNKKTGRNERCFQMCPIKKPKWTQGEYFNVGRSNSAVCSIHDSLYICGGWGLSLLSSIEKYKNSNWVCLSFRITPYSSCAMVPISNTRVLILGQDENLDYCVEEVNFCRKSVKKCDNLAISSTKNYNFLCHNRTFASFDSQKAVHKVEMVERNWSDLEAFFLTREKLNLKLI